MCHAAFLNVWWGRAEQERVEWESQNIWRSKHPESHRTGTVYWWEESSGDILNFRDKTRGFTFTPSYQPESADVSSVVLCLYRLDLSGKCRVRGKEEKEPDSLVSAEFIERFNWIKTHIEPWCVLVLARSGLMYTKLCWLTQFSAHYNLIRRTPATAS